AQLIARIMDYRGRFVYDTSKPNGQPRRQLSVERAERLLGWRAHTSFEEGLGKTIAWWRETNR
ncbi:MAG: GDP-L-fucose synthase, partial [Polyangia bacterium]